MPAGPPHSPFSRPPPPRASRRYPLRATTVVGNVLLTAAMLALVWQLWPSIARWWFEGLQFWLTRIDLPGLSLQRLPPRLPWDEAPLRIRLDTPLPTGMQWWGWVVVSAAAFGLSLRLSRERLPLIYLLRLLVLMQVSALVYFWFWPARLPLTLAHFAEDVVQVAGTLLFVTPLLHGIILYVFPIPLWHKVLATALSLGFVVVALPLHVSVLMLLVSWGSAMLLPLLYFLGTLLPYLMGLVGIYGDMLSLAPGEHSLRHEW